ncbi:MAG: DNA-binding transcriptional LysR family regulator [Ascidiaceihabitans sp.]|jgi:DNA-binding transcriptional LysR family regulator
MNIDWSLLRTFLTVEQAGTVTKAATQLACSQPTVSRQLKELETQTGLTLFDRRGYRLVLTDAGVSILEFAQNMAHQADHLALAIAGKETAVTGTIRISTSEVIAYHFLPLVLVGLQEEYPEIDVEIVVENSVANLSSREADIAIRLFRPDKLGLVRTKIGALEIGAFASKSYLKLHGVPHTLDDLVHHNLLGYDQSTEILDGFRMHIPTVDSSLFSVRCDNHLVYWNMIRAGNGIGFCSTLMASQDKMLTRVLPDLKPDGNDVWLATHEALQKTPRVRAVWEFLSSQLTKRLSTP